MPDALPQSSPSALPSPADPGEYPLCPSCGSPEVRFRVSVLTQVCVSWDAEDQCLAVIDGQPLSGLEWLDGDSAECGGCGWQGFVRDIRLPEEDL